MESGLLNAFHDDHYDGNYSTFETETNYWPHGNDSLGLQLSEALDGILPLSPVEEKPLIDNEHDRKFSFHLHDTYSEQTNCIINSWKQDTINSQYLKNEYQESASSPSIEIISVDPNCDYTSSSSNSDEDSEEEYDEDVISVECSSRASRRTLSSSIGDYESHTSDEIDSDDDEVVSKNGIFFYGTDTLKKQQQIELSHKLEKEDEIKDQELLKEPITTYRVCSEGKNGLNFLEAEIIDMKNFDLASFITQDDYGLTQYSSNHAEKEIRPSIDHQTNSIKNSNLDIDSEAESIVDVETVESDVLFENKSHLENNEFNNKFTTQIEDDPIKDPSWTPATKNSKSQKLQKPRNRNSFKSPNPANNKTLSVNKLRSSMVKKLPSTTLGKAQCLIENTKNVGLGRGKNISMCSKPDNACSSEPDLESQIQDNKITKEMLKDNPHFSAMSQHKIKPSVNNKEITKILKNNVHEKILPSMRSVKRTIEVEIKGNQIIEVQPKETAAKPTFLKITNSAEAQNLVSIGNCIKNENENNVMNSQGNSTSTKIEENLSESISPPPKKKLNLEEYKIRRGKNLPHIENANSASSYQSKLNHVQSDVKVKVVKDTNSNQPNTLNMVSLKSELSQKQIVKGNIKTPGVIERQFYDPIIEAKNKVLRLQELRKAAQTKLIDSTVSAKVGPVTKILPLEEIVKTSKNNKIQNKQISLLLNAEYEEIIIVSAGVNTIVSLPPFEKVSKLVKNSNNCSNSLLQSNALLYNISSTLQKANSSENIKISSNSLISSIKDVVLKKSSPPSLKTSTLPSLSPPETAKLPLIQLSSIKPVMPQNVSCNGPIPVKNDVVSEHGEDKIIMHLRKDRIRPKKQTISVQTDVLPEFPPLSLIIPSKSLVEKSKSAVKKERTRRRQYRTRRTSCSSDENDCNSRSRSRVHSISSQGSGTASSISKHTRHQSRKYKRRHSRKHSYRSRSRSNSRCGTPTHLDSHYKKRDRKRKVTSTSCSEHSYTGSSRSSSRSRSSSDSCDSSRSRSRSRSESRSRYLSNRSRTDKRHFERHSSPAVEERRIVYVGRIEPETSKEDLKRKFQSYGPIRQVTIHYKDTGMKYGFVTFEKAQDAFKAIDNGARDAKINVYDISFGGRRAFCKATYSDLDGAATKPFQVCSSYSPVIKKPPATAAAGTFEDLLKEVKQRMLSVKSAGSSRVKT